MEWYAERGPGSSNRHIHHQTTAQKWDTISERCNDMGVVRTPGQCKDKWDHTRKDFKKVWNYEQNTPSGRSNFWAMTGSEGKSTLKLSTIMAKDVYDQLCSWLPGQSREFDTQNFMDTTAMNNPSGNYFFPQKFPFLNFLFSSSLELHVFFVFYFATYKTLNIKSRVTAASSSEGV
jgi:hypothetical protein